VFISAKKGCTKISPEPMGARVQLRFPYQERTAFSCAGKNQKMLKPLFKRRE
jgi:hypothetical protein